MKQPSVAVAECDVSSALAEQSERNTAFRVTLVTCASSEHLLTNIRSLKSELIHSVDVDLVVLSETEFPLDRASIFVVPEGTKLSKLRRLACTVESDLVCICDPDVEVSLAGATAILEEAIKASSMGQEVVAFGMIDCHDNGTLLARVVAIDKWMSHRVIRPFLWTIGLGITLPGQFLVLSTSVLKRIDPAVDSYLDDLYLGWIARSSGVSVRRVSVVAGAEESRSAWSTLLTQRLRWMHGLANLFSHLSRHPSAVLLLSVHFIAYHGLPILWMLCMSTLAVFFPASGAVVFSVAAFLLSRLSQQSLTASATFLLIFPPLHCVATLLWWAPVSRQTLRQR